MYIYSDKENDEIRKVSENLDATAVAPVAPADTSLFSTHGL